ncbi:hypothetical protein CHS0354_002117 [Potamilus streckersoni]|uniref:protein-tyrosine-phosphatase n=1 Tax=Potamilus streckersoni TaxID=2493646 RepID=A0AAE0WE15_9BIVA|nr:hypothetical protein CHS0354_002117 [Potamilus streckersoni]
MSVSLWMKSVSWIIVIVVIGFHTVIYDQLSGFLLYIGNESSPWTYKNRPIESIASRKPQYVFQPKDDVARFISVVRNNQWILTICEVQVFGECLDGVYSKFCNKTCGHCYAGLLCNKETGKCPKGCDMGWKGETCDTECENGTYGYGCNETCGGCLGGNSCSIRDGNCTSGCIAGWQGITCKEECKNGTYGNGCSETCGRCFKGNDSCSVIDGHCIDGCKAGWQGRTCKNACDKGTYGHGCNETCGHCLNGIDTCLASNGTCQEGCKAGFQNIVCKQECDKGTYGIACNKTCGNCLSGNDSCSKTDGQCTDGCQAGWQGATCKQEMRNAPQSTTHGNTIVIIIVVSVVLVTLIVIAVLIVIIKKRIKRKRKEEDILEKTKKEEKFFDRVSEEKPCNDLQLEEDEDVEETSVLSEGVYPNTEKKKQLIAQRIPVLKFWDYVMTKKANKAELESEFHELTEGLSKKHDVALANPSTNRYKSMYPYDFNRVVLKRDLTQSTENLDESDYINASHIKDYEGRRKYIACQGPTDKTIYDFWWMIWQEKIECIVMLTNLVEMGKVKCKQYWPEEGEAVYGSVKVKLIRVEAGPEYVKRSLDITVGDKSRRVAQFHYKAWPDKDVPDTAWSLVGFWKDVRKRKICGEGPMVVHCSAGVGRTGTFIALDIICNDVSETGHVAIMRCVDNLREQRVNMVQTANQYMFLHEVVAEALGFGTMPVFEKQFPDVFRHLMEKDEHSGTTFLERQYKMMLNADSGNDEGVLQVYSNISSFQYENIRLPNLSGKDAYIVAKWTGDEQSMVNNQQYNVKTVINVDSETPKDAWFFLEVNGSKTVSGITVTCIGKEELDVLERKQFTITNGKMTESSDVTVFLLNFWQKSHDVPPDTSSILTLLENINQWHPSPTESNQILIYSRFEMNRCGVIYTLMTEKERIRRDGEIHILRTCVDMLARSRTLLPTLDQYVFLHKCILSHATQECTYENTAALNRIKEIL